MDYRAMVNPTYITAKSTLLMLAGAGNADAKRMIAALGTQDELSQNVAGSGQARLPISEMDMKALMAGSTLAIEARYAALSRFMQAEGYTSLLDIACGYTPRFLYCDKAGIDYIGLDVPVVAEELCKAADGLGIRKEHPVFMGGDATNAASLSAAAELLHGKLLISCEGLSVYLSADEFEQLTGGIREILLRHGGAWVTSDMGVDYEAFGTAAMSSPDAVELYHNARKVSMKASNIYDEGVTNWNAEKRREFLESHGLKVEAVPFYHGDEDLNLLKELPEAWKTALMRELKASTLWKMTADPAFVQTQAIAGAKQVENLHIDFTKSGGVLNCSAAGRIDTISAPALLEVFENNYDGIREVRLDASALEYISSAGLRVLLMAVKKLGAGTVTVLNASAAVKDIFETTGFDQMITVE